VTELTVDDTKASEWRAGFQVVLAALFGISLGVTGLFFYSIGVFLKPVAAEFGWTRAAVSTVSLVAALTLAFSAPLIGRLADFVGARVVAAVGTLGLAVGFLALSYASARYSVYLCIAAATVLLGSGTAPVIYTRPINLRFKRARGSALGVAQTATGIAGALIPPLLVPFVAHHGWRAGYQALAVCALASLPIVFLLLGRPIHPRIGVNSTTHSGLSLSEAVRTRAFLTLVAIVALAAVGVGGIVVHLIALLTDAGLSSKAASAYAGLLGVGIICGRIITGVSVDRWFAPRVAFIAFFAAAWGCWLLAGTNASWAGLSTVLIGLAMGAEIDLISYLIPRYFGMKAYGGIYGWLYAAFMIGTSLGPLLAGAAFDHYGDYALATSVLGVFLAAAAILTWLLPRFEF